LRASGKASAIPGPLLSPPDGDGVNMRKPAAAPVAARKASLPAGSRDNAAVEVVCMALAVALVVLAFRIASTW